MLVTHLRPHSLAIFGRNWEKTATLNPKRFRNLIFGYGNVVQEHVSGIASSKVRMGSGLVKNTTSNLTSRPTEKISQSSAKYLQFWTYIHFLRLWESAKKGRFVSNLRSFWSQMCAPGENINRITRKVSATRFLDMAMWFRTMFCEFWHHQRPR